MSSNNGVSSAQTQQQQAPKYDATGINVRTSHGYEFYRKFLGFMTPLHNMRHSDLKVLAHILLRREELSKACDDKNIIDELLFSSTERQRICERIGCSMQHFRQSLTQLRKRGAIVDNKIKKEIIPQFINGGDYLLIIHFDFNDSIQP